MKTILLLISCAVAVTLMAAEDEHLPTLKIGSEVYTNVTVTSVTATHVYFTHSRGMGNAKLKDLEPGLQQHFHYNAANGTVAEARQAQANALYRLGSSQAQASKNEDSARTVSRPQTSDADIGIPPHEIYAKSFLNQAAPALYVEKWLTPEPDRNGKFVLIDFWATWCGPCRRSITHLNTLYGIFKKRLVIIGLSSETEFEVRKMTSPGITYSVAIDTRQRTHSAAEVRGIPHTILIDPKGIVRFEGMPNYLDEQNLAKLLDRYEH
jgi:cytochrome c biogenesis protein CcmG, thiol:disulfide interchange protein DsbE